MDLKLERYLFIADSHHDECTRSKMLDFDYRAELEHGRFT